MYKHFNIEHEKYGKQNILLDDADAHLFDEYKWKLVVGAKRKNHTPLVVRARVNVEPVQWKTLPNGKRYKKAQDYFLHRLVRDDVPPKERIYAVNGDWLDCRRDNLKTAEELFSYDDVTEELSINSLAQGEVHTTLIEKEVWDQLNQEYDDLRITASRKKSGHTEPVYVIAYWGPRPKGGLKESKPLTHLIMNPPRGMVVDHINGNTLDNRRCNLRVCTHAENARNNTLIKTTTTGYKGVHCAKANGSKKPWRSRIKYNYKEIQLGTFDTKQEAAEAYDIAALKYFGEFAKLNFPNKLNEYMNQLAAQEQPE